MFQYLHCYMPQTWEAQVRAGLIGKNAGFRFSQSIDIPEELKFNNLARTDGALYALVRELLCPFYIDRLQGGCYLEEYPYDMALIHSYRELLGENFWGFQMHEWMSNYMSDLGKLKNNNCPAWTAEAITETILRAYPFPHVFLESMNAAEMAGAGCPETIGDFLAVTEALFAKRQAYTEGMLVPCDSYCLAYPMELAHGAKRFMPEIGHQTPDTRIQVAYARGMAKAYGIPFGTYYEPWGGSPFSACCYQRDGKNEWNIGSSADFPFQTAGDNGGSSRSMQRRMHLYSYMAGASFMAEEWGMCNTFYDWNDFELSPYGMVKRDFLRFTEKYPDIGTPIAPIAVVLPKELPVFEMNSFDSDLYMHYPVYGSLLDKLRLTRRGIFRLFRESGPMIGTETTSLLNCTIPDTLDIVQEDAVHCGDYAYVVDLTGSADFAKKAAAQVCAIEDVPALLDALLPCVMRGNAMKQLTRTKDGTVYLLLTNNSGVSRTVADGEILLPDAAETVTVQTKNEQTLTMLEGDGTISRGEDGLYRVEIPAGGWFFGILR